MQTLAIFILLATFSVNSLASSECYRAWWAESWSQGTAVVRSYSIRFLLWMLWERAGGRCPLRNAPANHSRIKFPLYFFFPCFVPQILVTFVLPLFFFVFMNQTIETLNRWLPSSRIPTTFPWTPGTMRMTVKECSGLLNLLLVVEFLFFYL